jgi:hypothetical protein
MFRPRFRLRLPFGVAVAVFAIAGCDGAVPTDTGASAAEVEQRATLMDRLHVDREVNVLVRTLALESPLGVTRVIGLEGGVIEIPEAGLSVSIPGGALARPTEITVTAPAGDLVGYLFAPHGLTFERPVSIRQDLSHTRATLLDGLLGRFSGAYFTGELDARVRALEILDLSIIDGILAQFRIDHFSGYVIATD